MPFDPALPWTLDPQVAIRPESFGGLAYHFGTRRLSFLKSPALRDLVLSLADHPSAEDAIEAEGIPASERRQYESALGTLAETGMITARTTNTEAMVAA
ncbi:MAG TPA: mycofactocin biosynthesis chaperone MftB [Solirubrobacterales bacterium]|nr:mycofactocin biosynthesis chaperone MftB [Solirubrobacterales bacterium]